LHLVANIVFFLPASVVAAANFLPASTTSAVVAWASCNTGVFLSRIGASRGVVTAFLKLLIFSLLLSTGSPASLYPPQPDFLKARQHSEGDFHGSSPKKLPKEAE
jgi:hypothetical protein